MPIEKRKSGCKARPAIDRFHESYLVDAATGCWVWHKTTCGGGNYHKPHGGYGLIAIGSRSDGTKRRMYAHRFAYENLVGPIPSGLMIDHVCCNRACVNPAHLEAVTQAENNRRARERGPTKHAAPKRKPTHCPKGHSMSGNRCEQCWDERKRATKAANPARQRELYWANVEVRRAQIRASYHRRKAANV